MLVCPVSIGFGCRGRDRLVKVMLIRGEVLKVERNTGQRDGRSWDYLNAHILDTDALEVRVCRVGDSLSGAEVPGQGEVGCWALQVRPYKRGNDGSAELSLTIIGTVADLAASRAES